MLDDVSLFLPLFLQLPPDFLRRVAAHYRSVADRLERAARGSERDADCHRELERRLADVAAAAETALALEASGADRQEAIAEAAERHGLNPLAVELQAKRARLAARKRAAEHRSAEALRLASKGWRNGEIARRLGCSPGTVSKIIRRQYRTTEAISVDRPHGHD